jgi:bifunctional DNA-binding transcriptional regulator/antitoxin component of YhaV-PrlF toxin-antitoxin module
MSKNLRSIELHVGAQGRIVIPTRLRQAWGIETGAVLLAHLEEGRLVLEQRAQVLQRVKQRFATLQNQSSLADELIAERRIEAEGETV